MSIVNSIEVDGVTVQLELKTDGVYLLMSRPIGNVNLIDFGTIKTLIENSGVQKWDFASVLEATESVEPSLMLLISADTELKKVDETASVSISDDRMSATIVFNAPINGGKKLLPGDIKDTLSHARVLAGIDELLLNSLCDSRKHEFPYVIATGTHTVDGTDGYIDFFFNTGKVSRKPKELDNGKIDYLNLDIFQVAQRDKVLAEIHPPIEGVDGIKVDGEVVKAALGKDVLSPIGKNVRLSEDGLSVLSDIDGQIIFQDNRINVNPVLELSGNVDNSTGNIRFLGSVVIKKNVLSGFIVNATGDVEVSGVVEGATIVCDGDLTIRGGVQGMGKAILTSTKGTVSAKFIENATVSAGTDVVADSVVRCDIKCGDSLILSGKRGQLIGGSARVLHTVSANIIGSQIEASTEVQAGLDPDLFDLYTNKRTELAMLKKELTQLTQIINTLAKARELGRLTEPKKAILVKSLQSKTHIKTRTAELFNEIEMLIPQLAKGTGIVRVQKMVNPGVKITIGNAILYVKNKLEHCSFSNVDGEIIMGQFE